jgi:hypothetical protein
VNYCLLSSLGILSQVSLTEDAFPRFKEDHLLLQESDTSNLRKKVGSPSGNTNNGQFTGHPV